MRSDIVPGAVFPDYELSDHRGKHRKLSELQQNDPLVLVLSRGGFCPKERRQHEGLLQLHRETQVGYCRLVTISTDNLLATNEFRSGVGAQWTFISDPGRKLLMDLDIAEYTVTDFNPMVPHTLVLEPGLRIYKIYNGYWFFGRPTVEELRLDFRLRGVTQGPVVDQTKAELARAAQAPVERAVGPVRPQLELHEVRVHHPRRDDRGGVPLAPVRPQLVEVHDQRVARLGALDVERARLRVAARRDPLPARVAAAGVDAPRLHRVAGVDAQDRLV